MATATDVNNSKNVTLGKTNIGGYVWFAPYGTTLPTDSESKLDPAFQLAGFLSDDGITQSTDTDTTEVKEMGGATVMKVVSSYAESYQHTLIETLRANAAKLRYGTDAVEGTDGSMTIRHKMPTDETISVVYEIAMTGNIKDRIVVPNVTRAEFGDRKLHAGDPDGYDVTLSANSDPSIGGATSIEYIGIKAQAASK